ncbi:endonuclease [Liberiplasma polymorphum]|uniref:endonuclease n=1 Tax=Liberiplasma polymorphum TaxID=3374570 RepID=UPI003776AF96
MKKITLVLTILLSTITIIGCAKITPIEEDFLNITLESNLAEANLSVSSEAITLGDEVTITAGNVEGYRFVYWLDKSLNIIVSNNAVYTFTASKAITFKAIYEPISVPEGVTLTLTDSIDNSHVSYSPSEIVKGDLVTLLAHEVEGYTFSHWLDVETDVVLSTNPNYNLIMTRDRMIKGVYIEDLADTIQIHLTSNVIDAPLFVDKAFIYLGDTVTITAGEVEEYYFAYWLNMTTEEILSEDPIYTFIMNESLSIKAVYELEFPPTETAIFLDFETGEKTSYSLGSVYYDGFEYVFQDALIGEHASDRKFGSFSVRIRNGNFGPSFAINHMQSVSFYVASAGFANDDNAPYHFQVSLDYENWTTVTSGTGTPTLTKITVDFGAIYVDLGVSESTPIYFRIGSTTSKRINIDDVTITYMSNSEFLIREVQLNLSANIEAEVTADLEGPYQFDQEVMITAPTVKGATFKYWLDLDSGKMLTSRQSYTFNIRANRNFEAVYDKAPDHPVQFVLHEDLVTYFSVGDEYISYTCDVFIIETEEPLDCFKEGSVNTNQIGEYTVTYYTLDAENNRYEIHVTKTVLKDASLLSLILDEYYKDAEGLYGEYLMVVLRDILRESYFGIDYDTVRDALIETDRDPENPDNIILIYVRTSVLGVWDQGATWNREHVWPQSLLGVPASGASINVSSDLHNLSPADPSENTRRGNKYFYTQLTTEAYEPPNVVKGDVARMLFYMITMYENLSLVNTKPNVYEMGHLDTLLMWHFMYEVRMFEENRNNVIQDWQGNRNPFIDYPHLVELMYWNHPDVLTW